MGLQNLGIVCDFFEWNFRHVIFKQILVIDGWGICDEIVLIWISLNFTDDQSTLVQVMAWCRQATSHYLSQCWPRSLSPYGITRPEWVKGPWDIKSMRNSLRESAQYEINGLAQQRRNSSELAMELSLSYTKPPNCEKHWLYGMIVWTLVAMIVS